MLPRCTSGRPRASSSASTRRATVDVPLGGDSRVPLGNFTSLFQDIMGGSYTSVSSLLRSGASVAADVAGPWGAARRCLFS
ncbi:hypothetical protein [Sorangium sp. So ce117]|uniref:hypothetical protein n=1 Tax=Sorangium sp. So ce117 TaxID=3133277 RepID=UPI003F62E608